MNWISPACPWTHNPGSHRTRVDELTFFNQVGDREYDLLFDPTSWVHHKADCSCECGHRWTLEWGTPNESGIPTVNQTPKMEIVEPVSVSCSLTLSEWSNAMQIIARALEPQGGYNPVTIEHAQWVIDRVIDGRLAVVGEDTYAMIEKDPNVKPQTDGGDRAELDNLSAQQINRLIKRGNRR